MTRYLVDHNALLELGRTRRASAFFRSHCLVSADVLHEARELTDMEALQRLGYELSPLVLTYLREVMESVPTGDTDLVDLYQNKGAADPVLVATALAATHASEDLLWSDRLVIVTRDKAVRAKAKEFGIGVILPDELAHLIDTTEDSRAP